VSLDEIDRTGNVEGVMATLGITRTDALMLVRSFVFVEGEHDGALIEALFCRELSERGAVVKQMRGAKNIEANITAEFLLAYSDARIRVVLDNLKENAVGHWNEARRYADDSDPIAARRALERLSRERGREASWLSEAGIAALQRQQLGRIEGVGLRRPDIIQYLPVGAFVPGAESWQKLFSDYRNTQSSLDFKGWLRKERGAVINSERIREAAEQLTELDDLRKVIDDL